MICSNCTAAESRKHWGGYSMSCARCCARLMRSARPLRGAQESILAAIAMRPDRPTKAQVIEQISIIDKQEEAKHGANQVGV